MIAQIDTTLKLVDKAAEASDRWLFLAALAIIIVGGTMIIRWLVASLERKDREHDAKTLVLIAAHGTERKEWSIALLESKAQFLASLADQRKDFREELSTERHACAAERAADREARHAVANSLNNVALTVRDLGETKAEASK